MSDRGGYKRMRFSDMGSEAGGVAPSMTSGFSKEFEKQAQAIFDYVPRIEDKGAESVARGDRRIDDRRLRACLRCKMLKTFDQFKEQGCHNCPSYIVQGDIKSVQDKTTTNFEGMVCICTGNKRDSWVCRWQDLVRRDLHPGAYAITMSAEEKLDNDSESSYDDTEEGSEEGANGVAAPKRNMFDTSNLPAPDREFRGMTDSRPTDARGERAVEEQVKEERIADADDIDYAAELDEIAADLADFGDDV